MAEEKKISAAEEAENNSAAAAVGDEVAEASGTVENQEAEALSIEDKLKEAAENLKRVNADEKARKLAEEKALKKREEEAQERAEEAEKKRLEDEKLVKTIAEQKLAAFAYAEDYRKKLQRERSKAVEEQRAREKEERDAALREQRTAEIEEHLEEAKQEAERRNARAAELLSRVTKFAKVGDDGKLSVVDKTDAAPAEAAEAEVAVNEVSLEEQAQAEVESYLSHETEVYEEGDRLILNAVDNQMIIEVGDPLPEEQGQAAAIREELEALRKQREELKELFDEHRRFLGSISETELADEPVEEECDPIDPVVIDDAVVAALKLEGKKVDSKKALIKYLHHSDKAVKKINKQVKQSKRAVAKNEDENDSPALIVQMLVNISKILEIRSDNLSAASRLAVSKLVKRYTAKLADAIDDYNENVIAYYDLTGQELTRVSAFLPNYIADKKEEAVIPALSYRESYLEIYVESDGSVSVGDDNISTTLIAPVYSRRELLGDDEPETKRAAKAYIKKTEKAIKKLSAEKDKLNAKIKKNNKKTSNPDDRQNLKLLVESFVIEKEKLDCLCTLLSKIRLVGSEKAVEDVKKKFISEMLAYNTLAEFVAAAIDTPIAKISASLADEVMRTGSEVLFPKMAYRRELVETVGENTRIVGDRLKSAFVGDISGEETEQTEAVKPDAMFGRIYEAEQFAVDVAREESKTVADKKTLKKFLRSTSKTAVIFKATLRQTERSIMRSVDESNVIASLVENIRVRGRYIELLAIRLVTVAGVLGGKKLRRETEALYNEIGKYNLKAIDYFNVTGEQVTRISAFLPENLANGTAEIVLPSVSYKENYVEVYSKENKSDILSFEDILEKRRAGAYSPIHVKNRRLTENKAVTVTPINPPYSVDEMKETEDPKNIKGRIGDARIARRSRRKLRRGLRRVKRQLARVEKQNRRFDKKLAVLNKKHDKEMFTIESQNSAQERQTPKYNNKLRKVNRQFASNVSKLELKRAKANIERRRLKLIVERFVIEREFFAIACVQLAKLRNYGNPSIVAQAKNDLIKAMSVYNKSADACSLVLGEPIAKISSTIADEIVRGATSEVRLPKIVCFKEIIETVGDKSRVVGEKYRYGVYGNKKVNSPIMMGSPYVGSDVAWTPAIGVDADGTPIIGAANPTATYTVPVMGASFIGAENDDAFIYEAPIGTLPKADEANASYNSIPMMPPVYGFAAPAVEEEKAADNGTYEESAVNDEIAALSKYALKAARAKSLVVETPGEYRRYKRRSRRLARIISKLIKKLDKLHVYADKTSAKLRGITTASENKAFRKCAKKIKRLAARSKDQLVISKSRSIIAELHEMRRNGAAAEIPEFAANSVEKNIAVKFDLDIISAVGKLVEIRCEDLYAASKVNVRRYVRRTRNALSQEITVYNEYVTEYASKSGERLTHISTLIPEKIARKENGIFIPEILYNKKFVEEKLAKAGENETAYTICIPTPEQLAAGATVSTVANPRLGETENDNTITEIVSAPIGYTAEFLLRKCEGRSAKKYMKTANKAQSRIDKLIKKLESQIHRDKAVARKRRRKMYKATARYDRAVLRISGKAKSSAKYQRKLRIKSKRYGKRIMRIDRRYPLPELLESKRLVLLTFAIEQERLALAAIALQAAAGARSNRLLTIAKKRFIDSVTKYNIAAERTSIALSTPITPADEGWIDTIILDNKIPALPKIIYKKDLVELIGEKRRVVGERPAQFSGMYTIVFGANGASFSTPVAGAALGATAASVGGVIGGAAVSVAGTNVPPVMDEIPSAKKSKKDKKDKKNKKNDKQEKKAPAQAAAAPIAPMMTIPVQVAYPQGSAVPQMVVMPGFTADGAAAFVNYAGQPAEVPAYDSKADKKAAKKDKKNEKPMFDSENEMKAIKKNIAFNAVINDAALEAKVAEQGNKDLAVITKYMDFEISMLESARDIENFRYGKEDRVVGLSKKQIGKMIAKLKRTHREALEYEKSDNQRYYTVVMTDPDKLAPENKRLNRAKLDSIRTRLIVLLNKRDEINSKLSAIYTGTEKNLDGSSVNQKWRHIKNSAAEAQMRKDKKLAKKVARVSASKGEKLRMYTLLNKRLDAASTMALSKYRLKSEKNTSRVKQMLKRDIKDCNNQIRLCSRDIKWMIKRFKHRKKESGGSGALGVIFGLLVILGIAAAVIWFFFPDVVANIQGLLGGGN